MSRLLSWAPLRSPLRYLLVVAATIAAAAHVPVIAPHLEEAPYMGGLFIALTVACVALAATLLVRDAPIVYAASTVVCGLAVIGYAATRVVAFPQLADDVGNWLEPLGVVSVLSELVVVATAVTALTVLRRPTTGAHSARSRTAPAAL